MAHAAVNIKSFANHEMAIDLGVSVRNEDVFIIQSGGDSVNDFIMEVRVSEAN